MPKTVVKKDENLDQALRRFKRDVNESGTLAAARRREYYVKPSVDKRMRKQAARAKKR